MAFISSPLGHLPTNTMTPEQLNKVKAKFCERVVDSMDLDTLIEIVYDQLIQSYEQYDERDMMYEVTDYWGDNGEEYNNLLREVTP